MTSAIARMASKVPGLLSSHSGPIFFLQIFLSNVKCTGDEHSLLECENDGFGVTVDCTHKNDAGVRCLKEGKPLYQK